MFEHKIWMCEVASRRNCFSSLFNAADQAQCHPRLKQRLTKFFWRKLRSCLTLQVEAESSTLREKQLCQSPRVDAYHFCNVLNQASGHTRIHTKKHRLSIDCKSVICVMCRGPTALSPSVMLVCPTFDCLHKRHLILPFQLYSVVALCFTSLSVGTHVSGLHVYDDDDPSRATRTCLYVHTYCCQGQMCVHLNVRFIRELLSEFLENR